MFVAGVSFDGLSMMRSPAAIAVTTGFSDRFTGLFHGEMIPTTPSG
ncbi:MAG TPA: hypothetical protein VFA54_15525 [Bryobacterales bacterium]|nr:hypothetical protein [Bryobacterales bacterium]